jgi:hypothetical protein
MPGSDWAVILGLFGAQPVVFAFIVWEASW